MDEPTREHDMLAELEALAGHEITRHRIYEREQAAGPTDTGAMFSVHEVKR